VTLCMAWRRDGTVHFASDSRLTVATNSYADVGIKVLSLPFTVLQPAQSGSNQPQAIAFSGQLGMCFAGSAVSSLTLKESVVEILRSLQHAPGYTDTSMAGLANFVFTAYKMVSRTVCQTALGANGRASILIGGMCQELGYVRVFHLSTDSSNIHSIKEVLTDKEHEFIGSGKDAAENDLPQTPADGDYFNVLKSVIDDATIPNVGGQVQYGCFKDSQFVVYGLIELGDARNQEKRVVHYWRGGLDLNSAEFMAGHSSFVPGFPYIDPLSTFGGL